MLASVFIFPVDATPKVVHEFVFPVDARPKVVAPEPADRYNLSLSDDDRALLYAIVEHEASDNEREKRAIAEVVLNRLRSPFFPNTIRGVLFAPGQFCSEQELARMNPDPQTINAVDKVLGGKDGYVLSTHAMYFQNFPAGNKTEIKVGKTYFRRKY